MISVNAAFLHATQSHCYCCSHKDTADTKMTSKPDLDSALNELGMLSTTAEGSKEFSHIQRHRSGMLTTISEGSQQHARLNRQRRDRNNSEPSHMCHCPTENLNQANNCSKGSDFCQGNGGGSYQVVQMNTAYVTSVKNVSCNQFQLSQDVEQSPEPEGCLRRSDTPVPVCRSQSGAAGYLDDPLGQRLEKQANLSRVSRTRISHRRRRSLRHQRPYSVPHGVSDRVWYIRQTEVPYLSIASKLPNKVNCDYSLPPLTPRSDSKSTSFTWPNSTLQRSKSLDEVDFAKLRIAEHSSIGNKTLTESKSNPYNSFKGQTNVFESERTEMEDMSQQFTNLNVQ